MSEVPLPPLGLLYPYPSEIVTLGLLYALKGGGQRAFYRWLTRDYRTLFPFLPARTRLFRLLLAHQEWTQRFLAAPTVLGVADTYGLALVHPWREHRNPFPLGEKGLSHHRWIVGGTLAVVLNTWGLVCGWDADAANVHDSTFHGLMRRCDGRMIVLTDQGCVAKAGNPPTMKPVKKGTWNERLLVETFLLFPAHRGLSCQEDDASRLGAWEYVCMRLAYLMALFNILVQCDGLPLDADGYGHRSLAQFRL